MGGAQAHGQHNKAHKTGHHAPKGQRHKQREAKGALRCMWFCCWSRGVERGTVGVSRRR